MKINLPLITCMLTLLATSAQANQYPLSMLWVSMAMNCQTHQLYVSDPSMPGFEIRSFVENLPNSASSIINGDDFSGKEEGFDYSLDANDRLVLTKHKSVFDIFGKNISITIGTPNAAGVAALCANAPAGFTALVPQLTRVDMLPNIQLNKVVEFTGDCSKHSLWPNASGYDFYRPVKVALSVTDTQSNTSLSISLNTAADLGSTNDPKTSMDTCNATQLP